MSKSYSEIGLKILQGLAERGWTQKDLEKRSKVSRQIISRIMTGKTSPTETTLKKISEALNKPIYFLFDTSGNIKNEGSNSVIISGHKNKNIMNTNSVLEDYREKLLIRLDKMEANQKAMMAMLELLLEKIKRMEGKK